MNTENKTGKKEKKCQLLAAQVQNRKLAKENAELRSKIKMWHTQEKLQAKVDERLVQANKMLAGAKIANLQLHREAIQTASDNAIQVTLRSVTIRKLEEKILKQKSVIDGIAFLIQHNSV